MASGALWKIGNHAINFKCLADFELIFFINRPDKDSAALVLQFLHQRWKPSN
jgi:hypothetical protein